MNIFVLIYLIIISLVAVIVTIVDKYKAAHHMWRISEPALLVISALGGGVAMYITMLVVRHKTRKLKFMLGIPLIVVIEFLAYLWVMNYVL